VLNREPASLNPFPSIKKYLTRLKDSRDIFYREQIERKIEEDFSIDKVIKRIRKVKILSKLIMTKEQQMLLPFTFNNLIMQNPKMKNYDETIEKHLHKKDPKSFKERFKYSFQKKYSLANI